MQSEWSLIGFRPEPIGSKYRNNLLGTISPVEKLDYLLLDFSISSRQFDNVQQKNERDWELKCGIEVLPLNDYRQTNSTILLFTEL